MYAVSLLGSVRRIEVNGVHLLEMRTFPRAETESRLSETLSALLDIAELLRANTPFALSHHAEQVEEAVLEVLTRRYEKPAATPSDFGDESLETAREKAGVETSDSWLFVPLGDEGIHAKNWQPVFGLLRRQVAGIVTDFERISKRLQANDGDRYLADTCDSIVEMLDVLEYALGRITATNDYVSYRTEHKQHELLEAIERQTTAFRGDTDA
jgi:hypothetical protein